MQDVNDSRRQLMEDCNTMRVTPATLAAAIKSRLNPELAIMQPWRNRSDQAASLQRMAYHALRKFAATPEPTKALLINPEASLYLCAKAGLIEEDLAKPVIERAEVPYQCADKNILRRRFTKLGIVDLKRVTLGAEDRIRLAITAIVFDATRNSNVPVSAAPPATASPSRTLVDLQQRPNHSSIPNPAVQLSR